MSEALSPSGVSPLYRQLMSRLREDIAKGVYPVHSRIPPEAELEARYQVSRVTVRRALKELTREGLLRPQQGKGTFVCSPRIRRSLRDVTSFHEACRHMGCQPGTQVISLKRTEADAQTRQDLQLPENLHEVIETVRLRLADGEPVMIETNRFPPTFDVLMRSDLTGSLYDILAAQGVEAGSGQHEVSLCYADTHQARELGVEPGTALLQLAEIIYDQHGAPLHTSHQVIRGDKFTFRI